MQRSWCLAQPSCCASGEASARGQGALLCTADASLASLRPLTSLRTPAAPCSLAVPIQLAAFVPPLAAADGSICGGDALQTPLAQQRTHTIYVVVDALQRLLAPPNLPPASALQECTAVLTFLQVR